MLLPKRLVTVAEARLVCSVLFLGRKDDDDDTATNRAMMESAPSEATRINEKRALLHRACTGVAMRSCVSLKSCVGRKLALLITWRTELI